MVECKKDVLLCKVGAVWDPGAKERCRMRSTLLYIWKGTLVTQWHSSRKEGGGRRKGEWRNMGRWVESKRESYIHTHTHTHRWREREGEKGRDKERKHE